MQGSSQMIIHDFQQQLMPKNFKIIAINALIPRHWVERCNLSKLNILIFIHRCVKAVFSNKTK